MHDWYVRMRSRMLDANEIVHVGLQFGCDKLKLKVIRACYNQLRRVAKVTS